MNLWQIVTGNSSLPVQSGNTFWDHLNNQQGGGIGTIYGETVAELMADIAVSVEVAHTAVLEPSDLVVEVQADIVVECE